MKKIKLGIVIFSLITFQIIAFKFIPVVFCVILGLQFLGMLTGLVLFIKKKGGFFNILISVISFVFIFTNCFTLILTDIKTDQWVIHAGGSVDGYAYLNSIQGFENSISKNIKTIELDFLFTQDGKVVCSHEFEYIENASLLNRPTYDEVVNKKLMKKYDVITLDYLFNKMQTNKDIRIVFDSKEENTTKIIEAIIEESKKYNVDVLNKFIIQVYDYENYLSLQSLNFNEYWFTNYKINYSPNKIIEYFENKENVTTYVMSPYIWNNFNLSNVNTKKDIAVHTINNKIFAKYYLIQGVDIIYTDNV